MPPFYAHDPFIAVHQALQSRWLDLPMTALSVACEGWALALIGLALYSWLERDVASVLKAFLPLGLALIVGGLTGQVVKAVWGTPRPLAVYGPTEVRVLMEPLLRHGFPSGHSLAVALFASYTTAAYGRKGSPTAALAVLGGLSRIYVGAHWVADVIGGWLLGGLLGFLAWWIAVRAFPRGHLATLREGRRTAGSARARYPSP